MRIELIICIITTVIYIGVIVSRIFSLLEYRLKSHTQIEVEKKENKTENEIIIATVAFVTIVLMTLNKM